MPPPSGSCRPVLRHRGLKNDNRRHNLGKILLSPGPRCAAVQGLCWRLRRCLGAALGVQVFSAHSVPILACIRKSRPSAAPIRIWIAVCHLTRGARARYRSVRTKGSASDRALNFVRAAVARRASGLRPVPGWPFPHCGHYTPAYTGRNVFWSALRCDLFPLDRRVILVGKTTLSGRVFAAGRAGAGVLTRLRAPNLDARRFAFERNA